MHRKAFKNQEDHLENADGVLFHAMQKDKIGDRLGFEEEISFLRQPNGVAILLTNTYYPHMRQGIKRQDKQQAVFTLSEDDAKELRDYLDKVL